MDIYWLAIRIDENLLVLMYGVRVVDWSRSMEWDYTCEDYYEYAFAAHYGLNLLTL
jgi:hypothetical protein